MSRSSCSANDGSPELPFTFLGPQAASPLPWERNGVWDRRGEGLRAGRGTHPPQHNDNHWDLATVPHWPLDTQPRGPQVSSAHYTSSLLLNSLTPHLHTHHFFSLHSLYFLLHFLHFLFPYCTSFSLPDLLPLSSLSFAFHLYSPGSVYCMHTCKCVCDNYHLEY